VRENRQSIAEQANIDREAGKSEDLDMGKVRAKMIPKELTKE
jgi:hypothetical protein